jgi:hypothetical protein
MNLAAAENSSFVSGYRFSDTVGPSESVARFAGCWKNSSLHLILGGAAVYRCDNCFVLNPALAAEVADSGPEATFSAAC